MLWIFGVVLIVVICVIKAATDIREENRRKLINKFQKELDHHYDAISLTSNYKSAENHLKQAEDLYRFNKGIMRKHDLTYFENDIDDMRRMTNDLKLDHFSDIAHDRAYAFSESYYCFSQYLNESSPTFKTITSAMDESKKCLKLYDAFFEVRHMEGCPSLDMISILKEKTDDLYNPCFACRSEFRAYMDSCIAKINTELQRKNQLSKMIVDVVRTAERIDRPELLSRQYPGYTKNEISYCYKELIQKQLLIEYKPFGRFVVVLGSKAKSEMNDQTDNQNAAETVSIENSEMTSAEMSNSKSGDQLKYRFDTVKQFIDSITDQGIRYVDKRKQGGCLWIVSTSKSDMYLKNIIISGYQLKKIASSRAFKGNPGWFIEEGKGKGEKSKDDYELDEYDNEVILIQRL